MDFSWAKNEKPLKQAVFRRFGGEGETRTLAPVTRPTPLAGAPRHQLEYFSIDNRLKDILLFPERHKILTGPKGGTQIVVFKVGRVLSAGIFYLCAVWFKYLSSLSFAIGTAWLHPSRKRPPMQADKTKQISVFSSLSCLMSPSVKAPFPFPV